MSRYGYKSKVVCLAHSLMGENCDCVRCVGTRKHPCCRGYCESSKVIDHLGLCMNCWYSNENPRMMCKEVIKKRYYKIKGPVYEKGKVVKPESIL